MHFDLHCHTTASDGGLSPLQLLQRAQQQQLQLLAITDHDTLAGYQQLAAQPIQGLTLISGVELSSQWGRYGIHVVGLGCRDRDAGLAQALQGQQQRRQQRAERIAEVLAKKGMADCYPLAQQLAAGGELGRPHFAQAMLQLGYVDSVQQAFKRYLGAGKAGDIKALWPSMAEVVEWIRASGGVAVLAHPLHYAMTATKLRALLTDFRNAGGQALELLSGRQSSDRTAHLLRLVQQFDLYASGGSDFHQPDTGWCELGCQGPLPAQCRPVWELLQ